MAIDLILIALLVKAGGVFLGIVAAILLFRASAPDRNSGFIKRSVRTSLRVAGAILLFVVISNSWGSIRNRIDRLKGGTAENPDYDADSVKLSFAPSDVPGLARDVFRLSAADDSAEVAVAATRLLKKVSDKGAKPAELYEGRGELIELIGEDADSATIHAIDQALLNVAGPPPKPDSTETLPERYVAGINTKDSAVAKTYRDSVKLIVAGPELAELNAQNARLEKRADSLDRELDQARKAHGFRAFLSNAADDMGVGFGWSAVYFTAFLALWRGQTPGKRIAGVRVLRLDGKPLGWWLSFERFGGYAASLSVGLLGFLQILWDRNRQGLHDKACETVVVFAKAQHVRQVR